MRKVSFTVDRGSGNIIFVSLTAKEMMIQIAKKRKQPKTLKRRKEYGYEETFAVDSGVSVCALTRRSLTRPDRRHHSDPACVEPPWWLKTKTLPEPITKGSWSVCFYMVRRRLLKYKRFIPQKLIIAVFCFPTFPLCTPLQNTHVQTTHFSYPKQMFFYTIDKPMFDMI